MITIKRFGFFKELRHGKPTGGSLLARVRAQATQQDKQIARYLKDASTFAACGGPTFDVLSKEKKVILPPHTKTDGTWMWPLDLAYYVENYHIEIPLEFVSHMAAQNFLPPKLSDEEVLRLRTATFEEVS